MFHSQGSLDPINKCISGQLEELEVVVKLELYTDQLYIKVEGMYDHGFIYMDICY
jgi:hypothetical protein